jgi:hypothetical protein
MKIRCAQEALFAVALTIAAWTPLGSEAATRPLTEGVAINFGESPAVVATAGSLVSGYDFASSGNCSYPNPFLVSQEQASVQTEYEVGAIWNRMNIVTHTATETAAGYMTMTKDHSSGSVNVNDVGSGFYG